MKRIHLCPAKQNISTKVGTKRGATNAKYMKPKLWSFFFIEKLNECYTEKSVRVICLLMATETDRWMSKAEKRVRQKQAKTPFREGRGGKPQIFFESKEYEVKLSFWIDHFFKFCFLRGVGQVFRVSWVKPTLLWAQTTRFDNWDPINFPL